MFALTEVVLSSPLAKDGTVAIPYPKGSGVGDFAGSHDHIAMVDGGLRRSPTDFSLAFAAAQATLTWRGERTLPVGTSLRLQMQIQGRDDGAPFLVEGIEGCALARVVLVGLGAPAGVDAAAICAVQAVGGGGDATINGTLASGGVATLDVGRNVQAASTAAGDTSQTVSVHGLDVYDQYMVEVLTLNGTTAVHGKKAFKRVTRVAVSAAMTGNLTVGTGFVLGLPLFLPSADHVLVELLDNAKAGTPGTILAGDAMTSLGTSGDVRGTYSPSAVLNGSRTVALLVSLPDTVSKGVPQYAPV